MCWSFPLPDPTSEHSFSWLQALWMLSPRFRLALDCSSHESDCFLCKSRLECDQSSKLCFGGGAWGCSQGSLASLFPSKPCGELPGTNYLLITRSSLLLCSLTTAAFGVSILTLGILCCTAAEGEEHNTKQTVAVLFSLLLRVQWS